jgi:L-fuculose-phosphate aldolase
MDIEYLSPRRRIVLIMSRIYQGGMTTTSGGNVSMRETDGDIWITPAGVDKGGLSERDIVRVSVSGAIEGAHRPSSELPFHRAIYHRRPDLRAIVHAHPPGLVAFSIVRQTPNVNVAPQARQIVGKVGYAPYRPPGSEALGARIAETFGEGCDAVIMENHGAVVGGRDLIDAYQRFETLEFCARTLIKAHQLGGARYLDEALIGEFEAAAEARLPEMESVEYPADELALRADICRFVERACRQRLMISTYGTVSARWRGDDFLITPTGEDRWLLTPRKIVQIRQERREPGKRPSRATRIHQRIYQEHPEVNAIIFTQASNAMAFCVSGAALDTHTIPESYLLLRDIPRAPFGAQFGDNATLSRLLSKDAPIVLIDNDSAVSVGASLLEAFDRLEVCEFSARSLIQSKALGEMVPIEEKEIRDLRDKFLS